MRLDKLTNKFQQALADAQSLALGNDNQFIEPIHLLRELMMHYLDYQKWKVLVEKFTLQTI